jgi:hypothetical protein
MFPKRLSAYVLVAAAALLVVGCSSGGNHATPTTTRATTTSVTGTALGGSSFVGKTGSVSTPPIRPALVPCPQQLPGVSLTKLNAGITGLAEKVVPIASVKARVCRFGLAEQLQYDDVLSKSAATQIEDETNRLLAVAPDYSPTCPSGIPAYFITFASGSQRVVVMYNGCGVVTNGVRSAQADTNWLDELRGKPGPPSAGGPMTPPG